MKAVLIAGLVLLAGPAATAQPLKASEIVRNIEGVWGWPGRSPDGKDRSCSQALMRIWLEENGTVYKSQTEGDDKIFISKVGYPPGDSDKATHILISYTNHKQFGMFGQVVWSLSMPDKDNFMWREVPLGMPMPKLVRCDETAGKQIG